MGLGSGLINLRLGLRMQAREQAAEEASQRGDAAEKELLLFQPEP